MEIVERCQLALFLREPAPLNALQLWDRAIGESPTGFQTVGPGHTQAQGAVGVHSKALLRLSVGGSPFAAEVEVMRVGTAPQPGDGYRIAAQFLAITPNHRQLIERFISQ